MPTVLQNGQTGYHSTADGSSVIVCWIREWS